jgi:hypothetical protein
MPDLAPPPPARPVVDFEGAVAAFATRYLRANGILMQVVGLVGGGMEQALSHLPPAGRQRLEQAVRAALAAAYRAADGTRRAGRAGDAAHRAAAMALGAAGGFGGLPASLAELPVTAATILRSIQEIAALHGEDPAAEDTRLACLQVFAAGGPLAEDDGTDLAFLGARLALTGAALNRLISQIAPRLAALLGQKLAAQAVPVLGAIAGAGTNLAFARFYQEMAHVHFGLRRLARETGRGAEVLPAFRAAVEERRRLRRAG